MSQSLPAEAFEAEAARHLPLGLLAPSPTNPRKRFDPIKLAELAESIKKHGVMQPILARPNPEFAEGNGRPRFEIVAGERRWRASQLAGEASVLTLVRDLSDIEALELQLLENIEREDLHPMEEADGLHTLMQTAKLAAEDVAAKIGKSVRWVFLRLALRGLCPSAREAFLAGDISASVAGLIARMPDQGQQAEATTRILTGFGGEPFTYRAASEYLRKEFMLDLTRAPFNIDAAYKVAGPCHRCDKRSGSKPDLFDDVKTGDLCQDSKCFAAKGEEAHDRLLQQCRDAGHQVLQGDKARNLMPSSATPPGYFLAKEPCTTLTADKRSLFDLFGDKQKGFITVELTGSRTLVTLVPEAIARKALKAKNLLRAAAPAPAPAAEPAAPAPAPQPAAAPAPQADEDRPKLKPQPLTPAQLESQITYRTGELFTRTLFAALHKSLGEAEQPPLSILQLLTIEKLLLASEDGTELLQAQLPAYPDLTAGSSGTRRAAAQRFIAPLNGRELADLLAMLLVAEELSNNDDLPTLETYGNYALALALDLQLDTEAMQADAEEQAAAQVQAEEDNRLGRNAAGDAFATAHVEAADA